jgi:hypothetical protein
MNFCLISGRQIALTPALMEKLQEELPLDSGFTLSLLALSG